MRLVVTGGSGLLGSALIRIIGEIKPDWQVACLSRHEPKRTKGLTWKPLDVSDLDSTRRLIAKINPDAVVHLAAIARPDICEKNPDEAFRVNFIGTRNVVLACDRFDTELLFVSSDQVFYQGNQDKAHDEWETPHPANVYGETKVLAENFVRSHLRRYWIVRVAKLFGGPNDTFSFIHNVHQTFSRGEPILAATDWAAHATHGLFAGRAFIELLEKKTYGIYHAVSPGVPNYFEIAGYLAGKMGVSPGLVKASSRKELGLAAGRPARCELSIKMWEQDFGSPLPGWKEGIDLFLAERR